VVIGFLSGYEELNRTNTHIHRLTDTVAQWHSGTVEVNRRHRGNTSLVDTGFKAH